MKKFFLIVALLLSVNNLTQAYMLEPTKDSVTFVDSTEVEFMHFSNAEISRIIKDSESLNPQIKTLNIISTRDTVALKISDSLVYSFSPSRGESCWKRLKTGVNKQDLKLINFNFLSVEKSLERKFEEKDVVLSSSFFDKVHSNLRKTLPIMTTSDSNLAEEESVVVVIDSNLVENENLVSRDSNLFKKESVVSISSNLTKKSKKKISPQEKKIMEDFRKELMEVRVFSEPKKEGEDILSFDSSFQKQDKDILSDSLSSKSSEYYGYPYDENGSDSIKINVAELIGGIIIILILIIAIIMGWKDYKKNRPFSSSDYIRELKEYQKSENERKKREEHLLKE